MGKKVILEFDDATYDKLFEIYLEAQKKGTQSVTFEEFLKDLLKAPINVMNQGMNSMNGLFDSIKNVFKDFDPNQLKDMLSSLKSMGDIFGNGDTSVNKTPNKDKNQEEMDAMKKKS